MCGSHRTEMRMNERHESQRQQRERRRTRSGKGKKRGRKRFMIYDHGSHLMGFYASSSLTFRFVHVFFFFYIHTKFTHFLSFCHFLLWTFTLWSFLFYFSFAGLSISMPQNRWTDWCRIRDCSARKWRSNWWYFREFTGRVVCMGWSRRGFISYWWKGSG